MKKCCKKTAREIFSEIEKKITYPQETIDKEQDTRFRTIATVINNSIKEDLEELKKKSLGEK